MQILLKFQQNFNILWKNNFHKNKIYEFLFRIFKYFVFREIITKEQSMIFKTVGSSVLITLLYIH